MGYGSWLGRLLYSLEATWLNLVASNVTYTQYDPLDV